MTEWTVVGVIIALVGLISGITGPVLKLNTTLTRLIATVENMRDDITQLTGRHTADTRQNHEAHRALWQKNAQQDARLAEHEERIHQMERNASHG